MPLKFIFSLLACAALIAGCGSDDGGSGDAEAALAAPWVVPTATRRTSAR